MTTGSPGNNTPLIEARGLHTYYGDSHILHGIDITIHKSETVSLIGRNGMGIGWVIRPDLSGGSPLRVRNPGAHLWRTAVHGQDRGTGLGGRLSMHELATRLLINRRFLR